MVVPGVIPTHLCDAIRDDVWKLLDADSEDRDSWYNRPTGSVMPSNPSGSYLAMWHTQAMWDVCQHPALHALYAELWGTADLWANAGPINHKPPADSRYAGQRGTLTSGEEVEWEWGQPLRLHWDWSFPDELEGVGSEPDGFALPLRPGYGRPQAVLHLEDTPEEGGGVKLLPGFHRLLAYEPSLRERILGDAELAADLGANRLEDEDILAFPEVVAAGLRPRQVGGKAGSVCIWNNLLAHGSGPNTADRPRMAMYLGMQPAAGKSKEEAAQRVRLWEKGWGRESAERLGVLSVEKVRGAKPARLTALGRRLLGLEPHPGA